MSAPISPPSIHINYLIKKTSLFDVSFRHLLDSINELVESRLETKEENKYESKSKESLINCLNIGDKILCSTCLFSFEDRQEQIEHFRGDLHLYNLKQKLKGKPIVSQDEFENLSDISSISGSDSEDENIYQSSSSSESDNEQKTVSKIDNHKNRPKYFFKLNDLTIISIFRSVLFSKKFTSTNPEEILAKIRAIKSDNKWCIILVAAGHFAAAVFQGEKVIVHKTFHRYVVRAKRGGVQSQHDSTGKHAKSAGANIRRSQEAMFRDEIRSLIGVDWKYEIDQCSCVFIRIPQYNKSVLISDQNQAPFDKDDPRLRTIPFMTFRPTFNEVKRTHNLLSRVEQYEKDFLHVLTKYETHVVQTSKREKPKFKPKPKKNKSNVKCESKSEELETSVQHLEKEDFAQNSVKSIQDEFIQSLSGENLKLFNEIYTCCMTNNVVKLKLLLNPQIDQENNIDDENFKLNIETILNKRLNKQNGYTLLHLCSQKGFSECVWELLLGGSDPSIADLSKNKILPYLVSHNKNVKDLYRRFKHDYPNRYDYDKAKINEPLSSEKMAEKMEKEKEKKKQKKQARKEREAKEKEKLIVQQFEDNERKIFLSLTDQQKKQLMINKDSISLKTNGNDSPLVIKNIKRCWLCAIDISSIVPFEYSDFKFCTTKCLKAHRQRQQEIQKSSLKTK